MPWIQKKPAELCRSELYPQHTSREPGQAGVTEVSKAGKSRKKRESL